MQLNVFAQGHIEDIKNQAYLKYATKIDCNNAEGDNLSARICANLSFQKVDSQLVIVYNKLLNFSRRQHNFKQAKKIINLQQTWRTMRSNHCDIVSDNYEGGHIQAIAYLNCMTELTATRICELEKLYADLANP